MNGLVMIQNDTVQRQPRSINNSSLVASPGIVAIVGGGEQEYLDTAKELISGAREEQLRRNGFWLGQIEAVVERGEDFSVIPGFDERLDALTLDQVADAAARYLNRYVRVVLLPEETAGEE